MGQQKKKMLEKWDKTEGMDEEGAQAKPPQSFE